MDTDEVNLEEDFDDGSDEGEPDYEYLNESAAAAIAQPTTASRKFENEKSQPQMCKLSGANTTTSQFVAARVRVCLSLAYIGLPRRVNITHAAPHCVVVVALL